MSEEAECFNCGQIKKLAYALNLYCLKSGTQGMKDVCQECAEVFNKGQVPIKLHPLLGRKIM